MKEIKTHKALYYDGCELTPVNFVWDYITIAFRDSKNEDLVLYNLFESVYVLFDVKENEEINIKTLTLHGVTTLTNSFFISLDFETNDPKDLTPSQITKIKKTINNKMSPSV